MKIVIEIPEKVYGLLKFYESSFKDVGNSDNSNVKEVLIGAVVRGTPLPKGRWYATEDEEINIIGYYCSQCDLPMETENRTKYCPYCGCQMEEYDESFD